jgi:hypothetical protein
MSSTQGKVDLTNLDKRVTELQKNLAFVGVTNNPDASELFKIIHRPGWTTPAQVELAGNVLEAMSTQASALSGLRRVLETHVKESGGI